MLQIYRKLWFNQQLLSWCDPVYVHHPGAPSWFFLLLTDGLILMPFLSISFAGRLGVSDMAVLLRKGKAVYNFSLFSPT